jgi:predicted TIM-barrel fold metal-dependent hydrolase
MKPTWDRRRFLGVATSALAGTTFAGTARGPVAADSAALPGGIIDTHVHFYDPTRPQGVPWPPKNESLLYKPTLPDDFRRASRGLGVTGVVVVEASPWLEDNQWLLDLAARDSLIVGMVGNLEAGTAPFKDHLARFAKNPLFRGVRIQGRALTVSLSNGVGKPEFLADLARLAEADREVDFVGGPPMLRDIGRLAAKFPTLRIVIDHFPFDVSEGERNSARAALRELGKQPQVFAKVSNVLRRIGNELRTDLKSYQAALDELWDVFGPDRLIYGSNWPVSEGVAPYREVQKIVAGYFAEKGKEALEKYFRKNSISAYRWVERPATG